MAASTATLVGPPALTGKICSTSSFGSTSSVEFASHTGSIRVQRTVAVRAALPEKENQGEPKFATRRDVVANLLGAGAAMSFIGQALAANPGSMPRSLNGKRKEGKPEGKKE